MKNTDLSNLVSINFENEQALVESFSVIPIDNKQVILDYFKKISSFASSPSMAKDVITGESIGGLNAYNDGFYYWHNDTVYHFEKYNLKLPDDFIKHVLSKQ